ncbi:TIR domain-containing protein [Rhodopseudomonas pseudopalustris]|uniref:TIR domain-containing protein n=1 Tax=Rhodopseudomonas pseudopalustris TaxID=1513892 RepID=UPI003F95033A
MVYGAFQGGGYAPLVKHKIFVSYHHGGDQPYYDSFSQTFHDNFEVIYDNSLARAVDSDDVEYVMRQIRESFITGSSCTIVLVGAETWKRKYVDWEIKATLDKQHGLIGVRLPTAPLNQNGTTTVPDRLHDNIVTGFATWTDWTTITSSAVTLSKMIAEAKSRSSALISNGRDRLLRNRP